MCENALKSKILKAESNLFDQVLRVAYLMDITLCVPLITGVVKGCSLQQKV